MSAVLPPPRGHPSLTPLPAGSFSADSDQEKEEWVEAMRHAIAEALSNSEVAERIWALEPNRFCADCGSPQPDWASINLCVVICKRCAGTGPAQHPGVLSVPQHWSPLQMAPSGGERGFPQTSPARSVGTPGCSAAQEAGGRGRGGAWLCDPPTPRRVPNGSSRRQGSTGAWAPASQKSEA